MIKFIEIDIKDLNMIYKILYYYFKFFLIYNPNSNLNAQN